MAPLKSLSKLMLDSSCLSVSLARGVDPQLGRHKLVKWAKGRASRLSREEFPGSKTVFELLWTNPVFVSTVGGSPFVRGQAVHRKPEASLIRGNPPQSLPIPPADHPVSGTVAEPAGGCPKVGVELVLAQWKETYHATGKSISLKQLSADLTALKEKPADGVAQGSRLAIAPASPEGSASGFHRLFGKRARYPRFKSKKRDPFAVSHPPAGQTRR